MRFRATPVRWSLALACVIGAVGMPSALAAGAQPGGAGLGDPVYPGAGNGGYQVDHYLLDLSYDTAKRVLGGRALLTGRTTQALSRFNLDAAGLRVSEVKVNGRVARTVQEGEELVVTPAEELARGRELKVEVRYETTVPTVKSGPWRPAVDPVKDPAFSIYAQDVEAHKVFPCNDHPSDKARFTYRVKVPAGYSVVANGRFAGKTGSSKVSTWQYNTQQPMATELAQLSIDRLKIDHRPGPGGLTIRDARPADRAEFLEQYLKQTPAMVEWATARLGEYPLEQYGTLVTPTQFGTTSLEDQTVSTFSLARMEKPAWTVPQVMAHELVHQWFGDSVTPKSWQHVWLNEGHATYWQGRWADDHKVESYRNPDTDKFANFTAKMKDAYRLGDIWRDKYGPVANPKPDKLWGWGSYDGGALVLLALREKVGASTFSRIEKTWLATYRDKNADTADFVALASKVSGQDLKPFLTEWLYGTETPAMPGHPDWKVDPIPTPGQRSLVYIPADKPRGDL